MGQKHERLREEHHLLFQEAFPDSRIFVRQVGKYYLPSGGMIKVGKDGQGDSWAIIKIKKFLIHVEFEYKIGKDIQSTDQKNWQREVESLNGIYHLVKDEPTASIALLKTQIKELEECLNIF